MSEVEKIDRAERRTRAEARPARSRPARKTAASAHAARMSVKGRPDTSAVEHEDVPTDPDGSCKLSSLETKVLDAAIDIPVSKGGEGGKIADQVRSFIASRRRLDSRPS